MDFILKPKLANIQAQVSLKGLHSIGQFSGTKKKSPGFARLVEGDSEIASDYHVSKLLSFPYLCSG
jgi:hypothetical protein